MSHTPADRTRPLDPATRGTGSPPRPQVLALANSAAGSAQEESLAEAAVALRALADVELVVPADTGELRAALEVLGERQLVLLGGDGTLSACVAGLDALGRLGPDRPIGLVPLGTGNDVARALGLPLEDPAAAARQALTGSPTPLDLLRADDGTVAVNAVHVGAGAEAAARAEDAKGLLGRAGYAVGALLAGAAADGWHLRVAADDVVLHDGTEPVLMVAIGLGSSIGGGTPLAPDADPHDGLADVVVATATGPLARVGYALALRRGEHVERDDVRRARARQVTVEVTDGEPFPVDTDGEVSGPFHRRTWTVEPGAWALRV